MEFDQQDLRARIAELKRQHRELDTNIETLIVEAAADQLYLRRLKKRKLHLKDEISNLENQLLPDIIA